MKKTIKIKFVDFNPNATAVKVFISCLQERYEVELSEDTEWLFYSSSSFTIVRPALFFTGL